MTGFPLLTITGLYAGVRIISILLMFSGYHLMTTDGKEFIIGTILPDFFFLGLLFIGAFLYGKHKTIFYGLCGGLFILLMVTLLPRFTAAKEYIVIDNQQSPAHYTITYQLYKQVAPFTFTQIGEYTDITNQASGISSILTNKDYHIDGVDLLLGDFKIPLH